MADHSYLGYDQKSSYQSNLLISLSIVTLLVAIVVVVLALISDRCENQPSGREFKSAAGALAKTEEAGAAGDQPLAAPISQSREAAPGDPFLRGYIGRVHVVRDEQVLPRRARAEVLSTRLDRIVLQPLDLPEQGDDAMLFGTGQGDWYGDGKDPCGLRPSTPYMPEVTHAIPDLRSRYDMPITSRARVDLRGPAWPRAADEILPRVDTGRVEVVVTILPDATITYEVVSQDPPGRGFGYSVERALQLSEYKPAIVAGKPVSTTFRMKCVICRAGHSNWVMSKHGLVDASIDMPGR